MERSLCVVLQHLVSAAASTQTPITATLCTFYFAACCGQQKIGHEGAALLFVVFFNSAVQGVPAAALCGVQAAIQAAALKQQLNAVFDSMARDLQQTMLSSPQRAALLHNSGPHPKVSESQSRRLRPRYGLEQ